MSPNDQSQDIEYLGTFKVQDPEMIEIVFEGPNRTFSGVDLKGRVNAHGGFKDFEGPFKRLQFGPGSSKHLSPRVHVDIHISEKTYAMSSYKSPLIEHFMAMYPNRVSVSSNRPQDRSNVLQQAPGKQFHMAPTQFPAEFGTYTENSLKIGPFRVVPPQRQIGRRQALSSRPKMRAVAVIQKLRIVAPGNSARNTMKTPRTEHQENVAPSMDFAPNPVFHGQITSDQQCQIVPIQLSSTVGPIRNAPQLQSVPIEPKFRIVQGPLLGTRKTKKSPPREHQKNVRGFSTSPIMDPAPTLNDPSKIVQKHPLSDVVHHPCQSQLCENPAPPVSSSAPNPAFHSQHQHQLNSSQVTVEQQGLKRVFHLPYNGPVKMERSAYDELMDPNFKPEVNDTQSAPAVEIQDVVKHPKNKTTENKKEEKKVVEEPMEIEEELEEGPIAALEYEDPVEQLEFENYVKLKHEEHGESFLGMLLFDMIPGLRLDVSGQIARTYY